MELPQLTSKSLLGAVIWDMDGVIVDTAPYHLKAWAETFDKLGINFTESDFSYSFGQRNDTIIARILGKESTPSQVQILSNDKEAIFRRYIMNNVKPLPGVIPLFTALQEYNVKLALASSAPLANINLILDNLEIRHFFQTIISERDVTEGKPNPQVFLVAAERLGVAADNCIVVEDAVAGVRAAKRARMVCVAVTNSHPAESLRDANLIVNSLNEVTVLDLEKLLV
jgi:beta-phosphoglucomutase family hydrolase